MKQIKHCEDCKWFINHSMTEYHKCNNPKNASSVLIEGLVEKRRGLNYCTWARQSYFKCGKKGRRFERKVEDE